MPTRWLGALIPAVLVIIWELLWHFESLRMDSLSRPLEVAVELYHGLTDGTLLVATVETFEAALLGFLIASVIGLVAGVVLGLMPWLARGDGPSIDAMRPVPSVAMIPGAIGRA